jgi:hypothetical protein
MTVPKTALVASLLLAAVAAAASLLSTGPYDYRPGTSFQHYLLWFPPHAVPMNLMFLNVTWFRPEAIWFIGTYYVRVCGGECRYEPATIYVVQDGVRMNLSMVRRPQVIAMVAPIKIIVLNPTTQI